MFLKLKHVDKENSEYPANADYPNLTKKNPNIAGALSVYKDSIIWISSSCIEKIPHKLEDIFY